MFRGGSQSRAVLRTAAKLFWFNFLQCLRRRHANVINRVIQQTRECGDSFGSLRAHLAKRHGRLPANRMFTVLQTLHQIWNDNSNWRTDHGKDGRGSPPSRRVRMLQLLPPHVNRPTLVNRFGVATNQDK